MKKEWDHYNAFKHILPEAESRERLTRYMGLVESMHEYEDWHYIDRGLTEKPKELKEKILGGYEEVASSRNRDD